MSNVFPWRLDPECGVRRGTWDWSTAESTSGVIILASTHLGLPLSTTKA